MTRKLYKSETDKKISGVCGGIAETYNLDSTIVRLIWAVFALVYGTGLVLYIVAAIIIPDKPEQRYNNFDSR